MGVSITVALRRFCTTAPWSDGHHPIQAIITNIVDTEPPFRMRLTLSWKTNSAICMKSLFMQNTTTSPQSSLPVSSLTNFRCHDNTEHKLNCSSDCSIMRWQPCWMQHIMKTSSSCITSHNTHPPKPHQLQLLWTIENIKDFMSARLLIIHL